MHTMHKMIILLLTCFFSCTAIAQADSVIIIVNREISAGSLKREELQRIFLSKKTTWDDGKKITAVCQKSGTTHAAFLRSFLDMNPSQYDIFWKHALFTGTGRPLKSLADEADVVEYVRTTPGGIGYISPDIPHEDVKTMKVQ